MTYKITAHDEDERGFNAYGTMGNGGKFHAYLYGNTFYIRYNTDSMYNAKAECFNGDCTYDNLVQLIGKFFGGWHD